jgi:lipid-A-disaccharide synthase
MPDTIMIVTGETSGELYGALLASALRERHPGIRIIGIGGERMKEAGVELVSGISSAFGITEALSAVTSLRQTYRKAVEALQKNRPSLLVLIDYPDFNLKLAAVARRKRIKILYYVSPQVWAWRRGRVKKIARLVDRMAVILPFEEAIYRSAGLPCEFVGHPVFDEIRRLKIDKSALKGELGLDGKRPLLSLLPGSRPHELERLLPVICDVVGEFRKEFEEFQFCVPFAPNTDLARYGSIINSLRSEDVVINRGESLRTLAASDYAVVASGTASLQAVLLGVPIVVIYKLFPLTYVLGKLIVKVKHISLVNILSGEEVVRELLQSEVTPRNIIDQIRRIMTDEQHREKMAAAYDRVKALFLSKNASARVAEMVLQTAGWEKWAGSS